MDTPDQNPNADAVNPAAAQGAAAEGGEGAGKSSTNVVGQVVEALPNTLFRVMTEDGKELLAYLSGKMRLHRIRVLIGDRVELVPDPYGGRARVVRRL